MESGAYSMTEDVGLYCKSYAPDFIPLGQLLDSFVRHNPDNLLLTLSLPSKDLKPFADAFGNIFQNVNVVADESYCGHDLSQYRGWHGQQICKLMSWQTVTAEHYAVLDSDCYFIRDIRATDIRPRAGARFLACGSSIRTVLTPGNETLLRYIQDGGSPDPTCFPQRPTLVIDRLDEFVRYRSIDLDNPSALERSDIPFKAFGSARWLYYQPGQLFSRGLLQRLYALFAQHDLTVGDAIQICPWEYNWYGEFAATHGFTDTEFRVSPYLHFQDKVGLDLARRERISQEVLSARFIFVQMAARHLSDLRFEAN